MFQFHLKKFRNHPNCDGIIANRAHVPEADEMKSCPHITVRRLIVLIAILAVSMAAFRTHLSLGSFVSCVGLIGLYRGCSILDHCRATPRSSTAWASTGIMFQSMDVAAGIVGVPTLFSVLVYFSLETRMTGRTIHYWDITNGPKFFTACFVGYLVAYRMRLWLWKANESERFDDMNTESNSNDP